MSWFAWASPGSCLLSCHSFWLIYPHFSVFKGMFLLLIFIKISYVGFNGFLLCMQLCHSWVQQFARPTCNEAIPHFNSWLNLKDSDQPVFLLPAFSSSNFPSKTACIVLANKTKLIDLRDQEQLPPLYQMLVSKHCQDIRAWGQQEMQEVLLGVWEMHVESR